MKTISQQIQVNFHSVEIEEQLTVMMLMDILQEAIYRNTNLKIFINENEYLMHIDRCKATFDILKNLGFISLKTNSKNKDLQDLAKAKGNITCDTNIPENLEDILHIIIRISNAGHSKLDVLKVLRNYLNIPLFKIKELVDSIPTYIRVKDYPNLDYLKLQKDLTNAGAECHITYDANVSTKITDPFVNILKINSKIHMYKVLREYLDMSQIEAKNIVDGKLPFKLNLKNYNIPIEDYDNFYKELSASNVIFETSQE